MIIYEVDHYEVALKDGTEHWFGTEESALQFYVENIEITTRFQKILNGICISVKEELK